MSILGNPVARIEDPRFLTGAATFVGDIDHPALDNAAHVVFVRSTMAHAHLLSVDATDATTMPGVLGVFTATDIDVAPLPSWGPVPDVAIRPILATGKVRFVGEPIAAVVADTYGQAVDAAEMVLVDYDPLPAVIDPRTAEANPSLLFEELGTNLARASGQDLGLDFSGCEVVVSIDVDNNRISAAPIEGRVAAVAYTDDGRLTCWSSTQGAHPARQKIADALGLDAEMVRVIIPDVGGSFGAKGGPGNEECLLGDLAKKVGRPLRWADTRTENLQAMGWGRSQYNTITLGGTRDGDFTHLQFDCLAESGAYGGAGMFMPAFTKMMVQGVYEIENVSFLTKAVFTNAAPIEAFRGAGRPEAAAAIERVVDAFAAEVGIGPVEVRRRNYIDSDRFPYLTAGRVTYDSGDYEATLDTALAAAGYDDLRSDQAERRARGDRIELGIGLATYVEITAPGGAPTITELGSVELRPDGTVLARSGATPFGQGHHTTWAMIIADKMGVSIGDVELITGDTDALESSNTTGGSRSVQIAGSALDNAAAKMVEAARSVAADVLEAAEVDLVLEGGRFHVAGTPAKSVGWADVAEASPEPLVTHNDFSQSAPTFPFGTHIAVVEVDTETGKVELKRFIAVDDAGTLINPLLAAGQIHGGLAAGIAQALFEHGTFDEDGNLVASNFADYTIVSAAELPMFERVESITPTPLNPLGAKGIGESGSIGSTPAVQNAVIDALSPFGIRHLDIPLTPLRVFEAIQASSL